MLAAISVLDWIEQNPSLSLAGAVVLVGLFGLGLRDVLRFSAVRTAAIALVNFRQAIRRRVLWITPILMLGIMIVGQFQRPLDPQDASRQATMICLFATGLLLTLIIVMLACTSLPREIDSRVIYTVATKPATRLEIILGKILGFAGVSFCILLIMGLFSWSYLRFQDWQMRKTLALQLSTPGVVTESLRPTLEYYRDHGTLHARTLGLPESLNIYAHLPLSPDDRWSPGGDEGEILVRFSVDRTRIPAAPPEEVPAAAMGPAAMGPAAMEPVPDTNPPGTMFFRVHVRARRTAALAQAPTTQPQLPRVGITLTELDGGVYLSSKDFGAPQGWEVSEQGTIIVFPVRPRQLEQLIPSGVPQRDLELSVVGFDEDCEYSLNPTGVQGMVPDTRYLINPVADVQYVGRSGQYGQQLKGGRPDLPRKAVFRFANQKTEGPARGTYAFELRMGVERVEEDVQTKVALDFYNRTTGQHTGNIETMVETNRPAYINIPAQAIEGGDFDVVMHTTSNSWLGLQAGPRASIKLIKEDQPFAWNLTKSLSVLWMLSLLVIIIAVFCSTFLSWPIAVVLTVVLLVGRWAAMQVSDIAQAGIGRQIVTDMMRDSNAASANAVSKSVDALVSMLHTVAAVLPDISRFAALQDIQQGLSISPTLVLLPSLMVLVGFGIPLTVLAYVFLKYKEVAP